MVSFTHIFFDFFGTLVSYSESRVEQGYPRSYKHIAENGFDSTYSAFLSEWDLLFRKFEEIDSGPVSGPGMALAWAYKYFLLSFVSSSHARRFFSFFAHITSFYLKYFDYYLIDKPGTYDAASGFYFIGRKSHLILSDRELIQLYRGAI